MTKDFGCWEQKQTGWGKVAPVTDSAGPHTQFQADVQIQSVGAESTTFPPTKLRPSNCRHCGRSPCSMLQKTPEGSENVQHIHCALGSKPTNQNWLKRRQKTGFVPTQTPWGARRHLTWAYFTNMPSSYFCKNSNLDLKNFKGKQARLDHKGKIFWEHYKSFSCWELKKK